MFVHFGGDWHSGCVCKCACYFRVGSMKPLFNVCNIVPSTIVCEFSFVCLRISSGYGTGSRPVSHHPRPRCPTFSTRLLETRIHGRFSGNGTIPHLVGVINELPSELPDSVEHLDTAGTDSLGQPRIANDVRREDHPTCLRLPGFGKGSIST